jgi:site-specific DNA recombinase
VSEVGGDRGTTNRYIGDKKHRAFCKQHARHDELREDGYCAACGGRLLYTKNRGKGGLYEYFSCINRFSRRTGGRCHTSHYPVQLVARAVEEHYRTVELAQEVRDAVWADVRNDTAERAEVVAREIERQQLTIRTLEDNQLSLVQLSYKGLASDEVLAREQGRLESERGQAESLLAKARLHAQDIDTSLEDALAKTSTPYATYRVSNPLERLLLNQTFFKRILIGEDNEVIGTSLTPVYAALAAWHEPLGQPRSHKKPRKSAPEAQRTNPDPVLGAGVCTSIQWWS